MKKHLIILLLLFYTLTSCSKKDSATIKNVSATIYYANTGTIANNCGFLIKIDNTYYYAVNLADNYRKDQLQILIDYHLLNAKYQCDLLPADGVSKLNIDKIAVR